jgi:putative transposase
VARLPRLTLAGCIHHVVQHCVAGRCLWHDDEDAQRLLADLRGACESLEISLHAYAILPDHLHLLLTPSREESVGALLQSLGRRSVRALNRRHGLRGALWEGRYQSTLLGAGEWLMDAMRYVECNLAHRHFPPEGATGACSSLAHHLGLRSDPLVRDHPLYWALGNTPFDRQAQYGRLAAQPLAVARADAITDATRHGWPLGGEEFLAELATRTGRRLVRGRPGRPARAATADPARGSAP